MQELPRLPWPPHYDKALRDIIIGSDHWPEDLQWSDAMSGDTAMWFELELGIKGVPLSSWQRRSRTERKNYETADVVEALQQVLFNGVKESRRVTKTDVSNIIRWTMELKRVEDLHNELRMLNADHAPIAATTVDRLAHELRNTITEFLEPKAIDLVDRWFRQGFWTLGDRLRTEELERTKDSRAAAEARQREQDKADRRKDRNADFVPPSEPKPEWLGAPRDNGGKRIPPPPNLAA